MEFGTISVSDGISMGHEGMRASLVSREVIADSRRDRHVRRAARRLGDARRLRQVAARDAHGRGPARPRQRLPLRRLDAAGQARRAQRRRPRPDDHRRLRGGRRARPRPDHQGGARRDREGDLPGGGRLRRHVHRQHDGVGRRGARHVAARQRRAARRRPPPRRLRDRLRRGRRPPRRRRHHRAPDPHQGGVRERHHRGHGARRLDQRRPAPAGDRARGAGRAELRRLHPRSPSASRTSPT